MPRLSRLALVLVALLAFTGAASAAYPDRPIRIIVPFAPGAGADLLARVIGNKISLALGQPVIIVNHSGSGGNIGTEAAARSAPDGYTLLLFNNAQTLNASLNPKLSFDVVRDFAPVSMLATSPIILVGGKAFPAKTVPQLVALAKAHPGTINYGSAGYGTPLHFAGELLNVLADIKMVHVAYRGQGASSAALLANDIQVGFGTIAGFAPLVKSGLVNPIAAAGKKRLPDFPDLPTIAESGYPDFDINIWYGLVAPSGTPPDVIKRLHDVLADILADPTERADIEQKGYDVVPSTAEELGAFIKTDLARWRKLVVRAKITAPQ